LAGGHINRFDCSDELFCVRDIGRRRGRWALAGAQREEQKRADEPGQPGWGPHGRGSSLDLGEPADPAAKWNRVLIKGAGQNGLPAFMAAPVTVADVVNAATQMLAS
jgi:hypothetical protein